MLRMDYVESSKSSWTGRYSWGDENSASPGLNLNGTKLLTNFEQYMGTNTRVLSPSAVTETRFGYTRFFNSVGTLLAGVRNVVDELKIPGLIRRRSPSPGGFQRSGFPITPGSAIAPTGPSSTTTTRFSFSTTLPSRAASTRSASAGRSAAISTTRMATSLDAAVSASRPRPPGTPPPAPAAMPSHRSFSATSRLPKLPRRSRPCNTVRRVSTSMSTMFGRSHRTSPCRWVCGTRTLRRGPTRAAIWSACSSMPTTPLRT